MLFRKNNIWQLCDKRLTYTDNGEERVTFTGDISWWEAFAAQWSHVKIKSVEDVTYTDDQLRRYEHIKYMPEDFGNLYSHYVEHGEILEDIELLPQHPFNIVILKHREVKGIQQRQDATELALLDLIVSGGM